MATRSVKRLATREVVSHVATSVAYRLATWRPTRRNHEASGSSGCHSKLARNVLYYSRDSPIGDLDE